MAFGHEVGRALSDGQVIGRSEPFAKVFPSSRVVKRAVGLVAWGVLEDIALDAYLDGNGRLVAETSVRRIARNLGLNKDTVTRHLAKLREYGFVLHEENRDDGNGRYATCRYVLDPSACIERFTTTPTVPNTAREARTGPPRGRGQVRGPRPAPQPACAEPRRGTEPGELDLQLRAELERLGVAVPTAAQLVEQFPPQRIRAALDAVGKARPRSPAGWVIAAIRQGWTLPTTGVASRPTDTSAAAGPATDTRSADLWDQWDLAISALLSDADLRALAIVLCPPVPGVGWLIPAVRVEIIRWATYQCRDAVAVDADRIRTELAQPTAPPSDWEGPSRPAGPATGQAVGLRARLPAVLLGRAR
ncbi:MAG TPA: helix-turn-helix domain-containing protein [Egibacteraceae bacterium]|nr:helix-turn-helix domain-containing protein [Egibacteraceae bacterium]